MDQQHVVVSDARSTYPKHLSLFPCWLN